MTTNDRNGWPQLYEDWSWARGEGRFPIAAYSEFMPPPRIGQKPYGNWERETPFSADDPWGWRITAAERDKELAPGRASIAGQLIETMVGLATGHGVHRIGHYHLTRNPFWPDTLAKQAVNLTHERHVFLSPLALSKTQDDKGRVRWTLFGGSQEGPAKGFWKSFYTAPSVERAEAESSEMIGQLLRGVFDEQARLDAAGFRVMPATAPAEFPELADGPLPAWTHPFLLRDGEAMENVRYLLTFRPFGLLPEPVQQAYLAGKLHLLPSPASLVFWGSPLYRKLSLPYAQQILLLQAIARHANPKGIRVPQSGWLHSPDHCTHDAGLGEAKAIYQRTHRWQRMHRDDDSTEHSHEHHLYKVLFSTDPDDVGLYGKPMARNTQIWSSDFRSVLDGPNANAEAIRRAVAATSNGHTFGYRFFFPPMQAGRSDVFWHRPLVAFRDSAGQTRTIDGLLTGYMTAGYADGPQMELWPRLAPKGRAAKVDNHGNDVSVRTVPSNPAERAKRAAAAFTAEFGADPARAVDARDALTFHFTATRAFEVRYWKTIAKLAEGRYVNKNAADTSKDPATQARIPFPERDLDQLGGFLLDYYRRLARDTGTEALVGELPFRWQTDFDFPWMEGWRRNQAGLTQERNIVAVIPGRNRKEAVVMGDHYDTAYMEDTYGYRSGRNDGARMAASGADDNHSATAALMLAAEAFFELSRAGKLERDIWLVHLTGEEFPSDCLGARDLAQKLVERTCKLQLSPDRALDISDVSIKGVTVLDMIAHNNDKARDIFQIAPGTDRQSLWLAYQAHAAAKMWEEGTAAWNEKGKRRELGRGRRSPHGGAIPLMARHLAPAGEIRFHEDPHSTLFNTDGQIFSDAGIPTVLFMENYDINREGYHDTQDTMANIDLDYGAAVAAIAIETVARAATEPLPDARSVPWSSVD